MSRLRARAAGLAAALLAALPALAAPELPAVTLSEPRTFPESVTATPDGALIFGSLAGGTIHRAGPGQDRAVPWIRDAAGDGGSIYGVLADPARNRLWACAVRRQGETSGSVLRGFALDSGEPQRDYPFPGGGLCNDIAVAADGTLFATDMSGGRILVLRPQARQLQVWADVPLLKGIDGIVASDTTVYANNFRSGALYAFARGAGAAVPTVLRTSRPLLKPDGMRPGRAAGELLLIEGGGTLSRVTVSGERARVETLRDGFEGPTAVAAARGRLWVLESRLAYRHDPALKERDPGPFRAYGVAMDEGE